MQKLTFKSVIEILDPDSRRKLRFFTVARVLSNFLDLLGLAGIAALATSFSQIATLGSGQAVLRVPGLFEVPLTEFGAVALALGVAAVFVLKSAFSVFFNLKTSLLVARIEEQNAADLARKFFQRGRPASLADDSLSSLQNKFLYSCTAISDFLNARITFIAEATLMAGLLGVFLVVNPIATISLFAFLAVVLLTLGKLINGRIDANSKLQLMGHEASLVQSRDLFGVRREAWASNAMSERLASMSRVRGRGALGYNVNYTLRSTPRFVIETSLILGIFAFLGGVVIFSDLASQAMTIGVFMTGGLRVVASILPLQAAMTQMRDGVIRAQDAYSELCEIRKMRSEATAVAEWAGENSIEPALNLANVSFTYPEAAAQTLTNISVSLEGYTKIAIVGRSGAGKSTLFDLLAGFDSPDSGQVEIGGVATSDILERHPGYIGFVPQRPFLITASFAENVSLRTIESTDLDQVKKCLETAGLLDVIEAKGGLLAGVSPDSGQLSGGEIQRIGLARALYTNPKLLLLDEATSALDAETEDFVSGALDRLKNQMTVVLIAHRLSTVLNADKILYLDGGRLIGSGRFEELKRQVPDFAKAAELMDLGRK